MLVSVLELITALGQSEALEDDLTPTYTSKISEAQTRLETELGCPLSKMEGTDTFFLDPDLHSGAGAHGGLYRLRLNRVFVDPAVPVVVTVCETWNGLYTTVDPTLYHLTHELGYLMIDQVTVEGLWLKVEYTSGFHDSVDADQRVKQSVRAYAVQALRLTSPSEDDGQSKQTFRVATDIAQALIERFRRITALQMYPKFGTTTPVPPEV